MLVYAILLGAWAVVVGWQVAEHIRVRKSARTALINRAKDISNTLGVVMRSQRRFGDVIFKDRLESALKDLISPGELNAIALLNASGDVVASAGAPMEFEPKEIGRTGAHWTDQTVALMNLVDLGTNVTQTAEESRPTIILPPRDRSGRSDTNRPPSELDRPPREPGPPPPPEPGTNMAVAADSVDGTDSPPRRFRGRGAGDGRRPFGFGRPFWMSEEDYQALIEKQGVHSFVFVLSTAPILAAYSQDLWLRSIISVLASVSAVGFALAWRNLNRSSELEVRLVRASELNSHLKQMNLAAAGLAHETRNPLNIIRGLAQLISKQQDASEEVRRRSRDIVEETDRVTAQLNEFINYSRPREVRRTTVALGSVVNEVTRALTYDIEEKSIRLHAANDLPAIEADEQLLRQMLFNLLINAVQAVEPGGGIEVRTQKANASEIILEIRDTGPGVPADQRAEIFKPYFTTQQKGTGLGLAVVRQIVLAHGWEIECVANDPRGAVFRISHLKPGAAA